MIQNTFTDVDKAENYSGQEPVSLSDAKAHLRVDFTDDDTLIQAMITAARKAIENFCHISLVPKTITLWLEAKEVPQSQFAQPFQVREAFNKFEIPYGPIASVDSVTSIDSDGISIITCVLNQDYFLRGTAYKSMQISNNFTNNILVYEAGYVAGKVPDDLVLALKCELAYRYENRGDPSSVRATAFTKEGVSQDARVLAQPYIRMCWI